MSQIKEKFTEYFDICKELAALRKQQNALKKRSDSLEKEINVMKALKSPNIVKLYDVIREPKYTYIILELCQ